MQYSENLHMNLPQDSDPLEVSKLSQNFEILDTRLGTGTQAIVSSMAVGDITYSTRNLEEESGGVLIACDQRTIDLDAYPDLPRNGLYWPYPELVFTDESKVSDTNIAPTAYSLNGYDANTDEWIYINRDGYPIAYSLTEKIIYKYNTYGSLGLFRVAEDKILSTTNGDARYLNNDLTKHTETIPTNIATLLQTGNSMIQQINENSFFLLSLLSSTTAGYLAGFYKTEDGFQTLTSISSSDPMTYDIAKHISDYGTIIRTNAAIKNAVYPIKKMENGEMVVVIPGISSSYSSPPTNETSKREYIINILPSVWKTTGNISYIQKNILGGDTLINEISDKWTKDALQRGVIFSVDCRFFVLFLIISGTKYLIIANVDTNEYTFSKCETDGTIGQTDIINKVIYNKYKHKITIILRNMTNLIGNIVIDTNTLSADYNASSAEQPIAMDGSIPPINYMDTAIAVSWYTSGHSLYDCRFGRLDKRLHDRGLAVRSISALSLIDQYIDGADDFMAMGMSGNFGVYSYSSGNDISAQPVFNTAITYASNMTEHNGDIYWPVGASLYKIPKNKRQMPYIKNGYMKVLNEPTEGDDA